MCDPASISIGLAVGGGVVKGVGSFLSGQQAGDSYDQQGKFDDRQAQMELQAGAYEKARTAEQTDRTIGGIRQQYISAGIDASSGSAKEVISDSARSAALDEEAILYGAKVKASNLRFEANLARSNANAARTGGTISAIADVIGGVSQGFGINGQQPAKTTVSNPYLNFTPGTGNLY